MGNRLWMLLFFYLSSFLASVVTDLKDGLFRPNWISWSGSVCTNTKRIIWKMPRKDTRRYDSPSALAIRKWHNNNFHPLETSHYLSPGRGGGGGEWGSEDFDVWCKSDWFPSKALIPTHWLFIGSQFSILCWQQLIPPSVPPENHVTPPKSFKLPLWVHHPLSPAL